MYLVNNVLENRIRAVPLLFSPCWTILQCSRQQTRSRSTRSVLQNILLMMPYLEGEVAVFRHTGEARGGRHECVVSERREQEHVLMCCALQTRA